MKMKQTIHLLGLLVLLLACKNDKQSDTAHATQIALLPT